MTAIITSIARAVAVWAFFFGLYLLFAEQTSTAELAVGASLAALAAGYQLVLRLKAEPPRVRVAALRPLFPALGEVVRDTFRVGGALIAALCGVAEPGRVRAIEPPVGADPGSRGGRAVAIIAVCLAPNSFVVGSSFEAGRIAVHRLAGETPEPAP